MYRLLIVDDESDVADGLYRFFKNAGSIAVDLDVCKAYSAIEALEVLAASRVDILLTDIMMPVMTGLQLMEVVRKQWPRCRTIVLTGYNDFDYIYSAMKHDTVSYLLKTEGFDAIAAAVLKAASQIDDSLRIEQLQEQADRRLDALLPLLRRDCLADLVADGAMGPQERERQFRELALPLDGRGPVLLLLGRMTPGEVSGAPMGMARAGALVCELVERLFPPTLRLAFTSLERHLPLWLIQPAQEQAEWGPEDDLWRNHASVVKDSAEAVQDAAGALGIRLSFAVDVRAFPWEALPERYDRLKRLLLYRRDRDGDVLLISGEAEDREGREASKAGLQQVKRMELMLESGRRGEYFQELASLRGLGPGKTAEGAAVVLRSLSAMLLKYITLRDLRQPIETGVGLGRLSRLDESGAWTDAMEYVRELSEALFAAAERQTVDSHDLLIRDLKQFIDSHLDEDLSLARLAAKCYFNPAYLSRLFKQNAGVNLLSYINDSRINRARELLAGTDMKIHEIAARVGYDSPSYFTQFFKRLSGIGPQEYRDRNAIGR